MRPAHDTPIGTVHPYWARKPMNVLEEIITRFSEPGELVADPFMGSGTTLFAAAKLDRNAFGGDISYLSHFLVQALREVIIYESEAIPEIARILEKVRAVSRNWFSLGDNREIERVRFQVVGGFEHGDFELSPTEVVSKIASPQGRWSNREVHDPGDVEIPDLQIGEEIFDRYLRSQIDFSTVSLPKNSRIAIPEGAQLSHFFLPVNQAAINLYLEVAKENALWKKAPNALRLVLSASLPLIRLSDKKASSQWPFWRPKNELTSRNPNIVFAKKFEAVQKLIHWAREELNEKRLTDLRLKHVPAQHLSREIVGDTATLVLTDPPYGDQVPYLEYSNLWNAVLGFNLSDLDYSTELVKSDAVFQAENSGGYREKLANALCANLDLLDDEKGTLVWFYQDHDLNNWATVHRTITDNGFEIADVISIPKQRRSLKTVTSPSRTLDGDLLVIAIPKGNESLRVKVDELRMLFEERSYKDFYSAYSEFVRAALIDGSIYSLAKQYKTVSEAMKGSS